MKRIINWIKNNKLLFVILVAAALLRFSAVKPGFHQFHNDEGNDYSGAIVMIVNKTFDPGRYGYPGLLPLIDAFLIIILFVPLYILKAYIFGTGVLPENSGNLYDLWRLIVNGNQQTQVLFWARYITAAFGTGVVFLVYKLSLKLFKNKKIALVASLLAAFNYRQVLNSHFAFPDIYNAFFVLLSLYLILRILDSQSIKNYIAVGLGIALYFCVKFHIYAIFPFIFIHLCAVYRKFKETFWKNIFSREFLIGIVVIPIVVLIINPYHFVHYDKFLNDAVNISGKYGFGIKHLNLYILTYLYQIGIGKLLSISLILGIIISIKKNLFSTLFLFSLLLPFFYIFAYYSNAGYFPRNFITVIPILLMFSAVFLYEAVNFIFNKIKINRRYLALTLTLFGSIFSFDQLKNSIVSTYYYTKPWGFVEARNWAAINIPDGAKVISHQSDISSFKWNMANRDLKIIPLNPSSNLAEMKESGAQYAFINLDWFVSHNLWWMNYMNVYPSLFLSKGKVNAVLGNTYSGIALKELASWSVASFVKPWQAPDSNILIVKIPDELKIDKTKLLVSYNFSSEKEFKLWNLIGDDKSKVKNLINYSENEGKNSLGSLWIQKNPKSPVIAVLSPPIKIDQNKAYIVEGWVKLEKKLEKEKRDGVLRVDFYNNQPKTIGINTESDYQAVSSRVYGDNDWILKRIITIPPEGGSYLSVGFQTSGELDFWLDDVKIYESESKVKDPRKEYPYINFRLPDEIAFPYTAEF